MSAASTSTPLTLSAIREALSGNGIAFRRRTRLQPAGGHCHIHTDQRQVAPSSWRKRLPVPCTALNSAREVCSHEEL